MTNDPIIIALDVATADEAHQIVRALGDEAGFYKVGLELYAVAGMPFVRELLAEGKKVFLDLKLHDISETVKRATARIAEVGVRFLTVHASGPVMRAAMAGKQGTNLQILAVTVLTDLSDQDLHEDGINRSAADLVALRAEQARRIGVDGLVCSPLEVASVRRIVGSDTVLVTPGVRSAGTDAGDQKRVATPAAAVSNGADYLVIGRQITRAAQPKQELGKVLRELEQVSTAP